MKSRNNLILQAGHAFFRDLPVRGTYIVPRMCYTHIKKCTITRDEIFGHEVTEARSTEVRSGNFGPK